jgi:DNA-binding GntR family transcriptional regulator
MLESSAERAVPGFPRDYQRGQPIAMTKADRAYQLIRRDIIEGRLPAGMPLDQESLASEHGLSTTPVREALNRLESEGLVINRPHRRTVVAPLSMRAVAETYAVRLALDPLAARLAAKEVSDVEAARILSLAEREPERDPVAALHGNRRLHRAIYAACGNEVLIGTLDVLWDRSDRYRLVTLGNSSQLHAAHDEHLMIAKAILDGDADTAAELTRIHTERSLEHLSEVPVADADA